MAIQTTGDSANSYIDVVTATAYSDDYFNAKWKDAQYSSQQESALSTAALLLNTLSFSGERVSSTQPLAFPRSGTYTRDGVQTSYPKDRTGNYTTPLLIKRAQYIIAEHLLTNQTVLQDGTTVAKLSQGSQSVEGILKPDFIPSVVYTLLQPLISSGSSSVLVRKW